MFRLQRFQEHYVGGDLQGKKVITHPFSFHVCIFKHDNDITATLEEHLAGPSPANETGDQIKKAVVILFGHIARHFDASDRCIPSIVD